VNDPILNVSAYAFTALDDVAALRERLFTHAQALELKGTVLLAEEGINLVLAGRPHALGQWLAELQADPRFANLDTKQSWSQRLPFARLKVKIKREIIRMNQPQVQPQRGRAAAVDAATLARWLDAGRDDAGRPVAMLDTRNGFEVDAGAFDDAIDWRLHKFSDFPAALQAHQAELKNHTVVAYCTGGIRCEKAVLAMREAGIEQAFQLDGGILRYLERLPGAPHWHGRCFVFDERESVGLELEPLEPAP
jgi:UPF0176 protein